MISVHHLLVSRQKQNGRSVWAEENHSSYGGQETDKERAGDTNIAFPVTSVMTHLQPAPPPTNTSTDESADEYSSFTFQSSFTHMRIWGDIL